MTVTIDETFADCVEWIEEASNPLAGPLRTRTTFLAHALKRLCEGLPQGTRLRIERVLVGTRFVIVTMWFLPLPGAEFQLRYRYWWICER